MYWNSSIKAVSNASNVYQISDFDDSLKHIHIWQVRKKLLYTICKIKSKHVLQTIFSKMLAWSFMNNFNHDTHFVNRTSHAKLCVLHTAFQICSTNARKWTFQRRCIVQNWDCMQKRLKSNFHVWEIMTSWLKNSTKTMKIINLHNS